MNVLTYASLFFVQGYYFSLYNITYFLLSISTGSIVQSNLRLLCKVQQLKISSVVSPEEQKILSALQLSDIDTEVVDSLVIKHSYPEGEEAGEE